MHNNLEFKLESICDTITEHGYGLVGIQLPEGLKINATRIKDHIEEKTDAKVIISAEPCFGGCDLPVDMSSLGVDLLVHFGHSKMIENDPNLPVFYIEARDNTDVVKVVERASGLLRGTIGLITTVQHIHKLDEVKEVLEKHGLSPIIGQGNGRVAYDGQVLGCDLSSALSISDKVDCYLYIGSGQFHPLGVSLATKKEVITANPFTSEVGDIEELKDKVLRQRHGAIVRAMDAESFGILVCTKLGQRRLELALSKKEALETKGMRAYIFALNNISPLLLRPYKIDAYLSTACPRIAIDDYLVYDMPILTTQELEIILGERDWEEYEFDQILEALPP